jgi:hypothetical protein
MLICIFVLSYFLYAYIDEQNHLTKLRLTLPVCAKEIKVIQEENRRLAYHIEQFENPQHLLQLSMRPEFCHLKHPLVKEIFTCQKGIALQMTPSLEKNSPVQHPQPILVVGAAR